MNKPEQKPAPLTEGVWPPPPSLDSHPPLPQKIRSPWFRPAFWLGVGFNALFCMPSLLLLNFPNGSELSENTLFLFPRFVWVIAALLAFLGGALFAMQQIQKCRRQQRPFWWEVGGLLLCSTPFLAGMGAVNAVVKLKAFSPLPECFIRLPIRENSV